jgi:hypothetical protein
VDRKCKKGKKDVPVMGVAGSWEDVQDETGARKRESAVKCVGTAGIGRDRE